MHKEGLLSDYKDPPDGFREMIDFWSIFDTCGVSDAALASELTTIRDAVTDCLCSGDIARAMSLTALAMLRIGRFDEL